VFSPYYAWARRQGGGDPFAHCAFNVALYDIAGKRWAMTERGARHLMRSRDSMTIGPSAMTWNDDTLTVTLDEVTAPWPSHIRGTVRLHPYALARHVVALDTAGVHRWQPLAPCAQVDVRLTHPRLSWSGPGYFDANSGDAPLAEAFSRWHWSRASVRNGTAVLYDIERRDGGRLALGLRCDRSGNVHEFAPPPVATLPCSGWRVPRATRADAGCAPRVLRTLEDSPFYVRSLVASQLEGDPVVAVHESLALDRFRAPWVQMLLPFRMPRRA